MELIILSSKKEFTCTACAGTMILEFATLSRLTGNFVFEEKAAKAMAYLWKKRNHYSDLVGRVINVQNGDWVCQGWLIHRIFIIFLFLYH